MAGIVDHIQQSTTSSMELLQLLKHPMFCDLQATLASDCQQVMVPYTLVQDDVRGGDDSQECVDVVVEDATLQAEFRQLGALGDNRVTELENFYNTQSATLMTQRSDAMTNLHAQGLPHERLQPELLIVNGYYDREHRYLVQRVTRSLQLLKNSLPPELAQPGGCTKRNKTRMLNSKAVNIMTDWYDRHYDHPYPTEEEKEELAQRGQIAISQVKAWFANKRNRTLNTKPKRQKYRLQQQLSNIAERLSSAKGHNSPDVLIHELSSLVKDRSRQSGIPLTVGGGYYR